MHVLNFLSFFFKLSLWAYMLKKKKEKARSLFNSSEYIENIPFKPVFMRDLEVQGYGSVCALVLGLP